MGMGMGMGVGAVIGGSLACCWRAGLGPGHCIARDQGPGCCAEGGDMAAGGCRPGARGHGSPRRSRCASQPSRREPCGARLGARSCAGQLLASGVPAGNPTALCMPIAPTRQLLRLKAPASPAIRARCTAAMSAPRYIDCDGPTTLSHRQQLPFLQAFTESSKIFASGILVSHVAVKSPNATLRSLL
ncbi:hypothetical protein V8C86DRAFT_2491904 [Haematococcus lacustris]